MAACAVPDAGVTENGLVAGSAAGRGQSGVPELRTEAVATVPDPRPRPRRGKRSTRSWKLTVPLESLVELSKRPSRERQPWQKMLCTTENVAKLILT